MTKFRAVLGSTKAFYRIYPSENPDWNNFRILEDGKTIQLHTGGVKITDGGKIFKQFETDGYFYNRSQEDIYPIVMEGVIESVFQGQNAIIAAFGQTGSGKSLTIGGLYYNYQDRGLIPRTIENIFSLKENLPKNLQMVIHVSYLEILPYFQSRDLFRPYPSPIDKNEIHKRLLKLEVRSYVQALQYIFMAEGRKEYTPDRNHPSHAGTSILTFHITIRNINFCEPYEFTSKLHLIDLAGNDNFGDSSSCYKNYSQVGTANCIKSFMEHLSLLVHGNDPELVRVKKRTNVFSKYLGDSFNSCSLIRFIGHLKTSTQDHMIALSLLKFGRLFRTMKSKCSLVVLKDNELMKIAIMEGKLNHLYKDKIITQMLQNREPKDFCPEKLEHTRRMIDEFIHNKIEASHLLKLGDVFTILKIMKENTLALEDLKMFNKLDASDNSDSRMKTSEKKSSIKVTPALEIKETSDPSEVEPTQPIISQPKESAKGGRKNLSQTKSKRESLENDTKSISRKLKASNSSLNGANKRSSTPAKKKLGGAAESTISTDKASKKTNELQSSLLSAVNLILPHVIPELREALKDYVFSPRASYKISLELYKKKENEAKEIYSNYSKELKKLDAYFEILDLRKNEIVQTKLASQFSRKQEKDSAGNDIKSRLEEKCSENLKKAECDVTQQQEVVLNLQADFKIALAMREQIKNEIKGEFDEFCREKYNTSVQNLQDLNEFAVDDEMEDIQEFYHQLEGEKIPAEDLPQAQVFEEIYKTLRDLMLIEARKKVQYLKKSIKWIENTRN